MGLNPDLCTGPGEGLSMGLSIGLGGLNPVEETAGLPTPYLIKKPAYAGLSLTPGKSAGADVLAQRGRAYRGRRHYVAYMQQKPATACDRFF